MCGITGILNFDSQESADRELLRRMCNVLHHRGPDDEGTYIDGALGLGMRRLSIIDLVTGHQPISNEDGSVWIICNGEIYNFLDLRTGLETRGHRFHTQSDTEAIVHAYEEYGIECLQHLRGMFAFAIWDARQRRLFLARDRLGKKPLHYLYHGRRLLFASEIKAILEDPSVPRAIDVNALDDYFTYGYVLSPQTIYQGIRRLPPAHYMLCYEDGRMSIERYWRVRPQPNFSGCETDYVVELRRLLEEAVRIRLISDVPVGAFLSGGIDSSAVVALMAKSSDQPIKTFSIDFEPRGSGEVQYARQVAQQWTTDHYEFTVRPDVTELLPRLVWQFEEPFADSSMIPTYYVSKLARQHVTVALSGDGGDEVFAGYASYLVALSEQPFDHLPVPVRALAGAASRVVPVRVRGKSRLRRMAQSADDRFIDITCVFPHGFRQALYSQALRAELIKHDPYDVKRASFYEVRGADYLTRMQYSDLHSYLPDDILVKIDRASMLNSLETRAPLLDHKLIEFMATVPSDLKYDGQRTKHIFRTAVADLLPPDVLKRGKKGFGIPASQWFQGELQPFLRQLLSEEAIRRRGLFDWGYIQELFRRPVPGGIDHSARLWAVACFELWAQIYLDHQLLPS